MRFSKEKMNRINERINKKVEHNDNQWSIYDSIGGTSVVRNHWCICDLEELNDTIRTLITMKEIIESETGLMLD